MLINTIYKYALLIKHLINNLISYAQDFCIKLQVALTICSLVTFEIESEIEKCGLRSLSLVVQVEK